MQNICYSNFIILIMVLIEGVNFFFGGGGGGGGGDLIKIKSL